MGSSHEKRLANKEVHKRTLLYKQTFQISWKPEIRWVASEDAGKTPTMYCAICCKFEDNAEEKWKFFKGTSTFGKNMAMESNNKIQKHHS